MLIEVAALIFSRDAQRAAVNKLIHALAWCALALVLWALGA